MEPDAPDRPSRRAGRRYRVRHRAEIARVFEKGSRAADGLVTLLAAPNGLGHSRFAVAVSKKHGSAVRRNRIKRLCREAFRLTRDEVPAGWDYILLPRRGMVPEREAVRGSIKSLAHRAVRRAQEERGAC